MTAMTRAECERLGILGPDVMREMGEPESSIRFVNDYVVDAVVERAADRIKAGETLLDVFGDLCRPAPMEKL